MLKTCKVLFLCIFLTLLYSKTDAQVRFLFNKYADSIEISEEELEYLFDQKPKASIEIMLEDDFNIKGIVLSSLQKYENMKSMIIHCSNFDDAIFSLSKITDEEDEYIFKGRILHSDYDDGYELQMNEDGLYFLRKIRVNNSISG